MSGIKNRGFASLSKTRRIEIAASGGRISHAKGKAHKWNHDEAVAAGKKGKKKPVATTL